MTIWKWLNRHQRLIPPLRRNVELMLEPCRLTRRTIWPADEQQRCFSCVCCISCVSGPKMGRMTLITQQHAWLDLTGIERSCYECAFLDDTVGTGLELMTTGPLDVSLQPGSHWSRVYPPSEAGGWNVSPNLYTSDLNEESAEKYAHTFYQPYICVHFRKTKCFHEKSVHPNLEFIVEVQ